MGKLFRIFTIAAGALLLAGNIASAQSLVFCADFVKAAVKYSQQMRALAQKAPGGRCTGHNLLDPFWSTNSIAQRQWCLSVSRGTENTRLDEMRAAVEKCGYCGTYADVVTTAAQYNIENRCGFSHDGDERWRPDKALHFNGCMVAKKCEEKCLLLDCWNSCSDDTDIDAVRKMLDPIAAQVSLAVAQCKSERGLGKTSSALTAPKREPEFQDTFQRKKHPFKPKTKSGDYLSTSSGATARRATPPKRGPSSGPNGGTTSGNDLAYPSGAAARRAADPCRSPTATKPCKPAATPLGPGLLDSGPVFSPRGPAAAGASPPPGGAPASTIGGSTSSAPR
jgi:hypothetical protein